MGVCGGGFHHVKEILMKISKCSFHALGSIIKHITQKKKRFHDQEMIFNLFLVAACKSKRMIGPQQRDHLYTIEIHS
jgi:hypothetical protein